ncbi:J domain-containing protein [Flavobacterium sp. MFBS3-15]|uniref:J domain-containing protein n=1 Tax=Flavobacterium sp. MFBS3-15 TaxID=2989816 RepID=UPI0022363799|nr:J domain-containing protein [Flavobacterium sp. MFBS3-15]MCW4467784.1 J domain-containing protein [Flavobacterium sp. MFBS3-15]
MKDHYEILGVSPGSTQDEIKKAYRLLALRHHPDRNGGTRQSEEFFKQIVESYQVLSDVSSRRSYDYWRFPKDSDPYENTEPGKVTPATFLRIFKTIREKVVNADIYVSESSLFELINGVLTTENLNYLVGTADIRTNGFIIDEIVTASVFLEDSSKMVIYRKLIRLAHGDEGLRKKVSALSNVEYAPRPHVTKEKETEELSDYVYFFIAMMIAIVLFAVISGVN